MEIADASVVLAPERWRHAVGDGVEYILADLFQPGITSDAQVFYVKYANSRGDITRPHFHAVPQYQLFVSGSGEIGRDKISPPLLHYVDPHTPYGPIINDGGLSYITIRASRDGGAQYMPDERGVLHDSRAEGGPHRHFALPIDVGHQHSALNVRVDLIDRQADGLGAFLMTIAPGGEWSIAGDPDRPDGRRLVAILDGSVVVKGQRLPELSFIHVKLGEGVVEVAATDKGATLAILDYPDAME